MEYTEIETTADSIDGSVNFHVINDVVGFVLYMHQQITSILQDMSLEFDTFHTEYTELETALMQSDIKARRIHIARMREIKHGIKRLEKLMNTVSNLRTALKLITTAIYNIQGVILVLGASPIRPQHVYELCFSNGNAVVVGNGRGEVDFTKSKVADGLSRRVL